MNECTVNKASPLEVSAEKLLEAVKQFREHIYDATEIFMGNPFDLIEIDMSEIPSNCYFISENSVERNKMYHVTNDELKRALYKFFIEENPDRVFRGKN
jgi:hypothetical protein